MTELEQQLLQSLKQLQTDYETQFSELHESLSSLANDTKLKQQKRITEPLRELESGKTCLDCKHGKYSKQRNSNNQQVYWDFSCLIDHGQRQSVEECTHYEK
ncbi:MULTISPECIES: MbeD/MobD family mobilization/exclusion protein [unclassified Pseudoalteromonas]|uniref:MbeD/MobD family mobilization/exclusion protein n=1 Tax=unclassified Pseudoalteromonas TaxID=194690 RepID=UPI00097663EB